MRRRLTNKSRPANRYEYISARAFSTLVGRLGQRHIIISFFVLAELALSGGVAADEAASGHGHRLSSLSS